MKTIQLMNKIAAVGTDLFDRSEYQVTDQAENPDALLVRSASLHEMNFGDRLLAIARAGAGVNNIPVEKCAESGIVVFNTPGANANGVKELVIAALILAARDVIGGIEWVKTLQGDVAKAVEKGKSAFAGTEIAGKTLGVIGLGAIGGMVANTATHLGMNVLGCDPYLTVHAAWSLSHHINNAASYEEVYRNADYITLHVPATPTTKNMINKDTLAMMKDGVRIINMARGDLVNIADLKEALASGKVATYVTDFPSEETLGVKGIINVPHLGASTAESEDNCAVMAVRQLDTYLRTGNIRNSVNFPTLEIPYSGAGRICVFHKNIPNMISHITTLVSAAGLNIENMANGSKGENAYTILEVNGTIPDTLPQQISENKDIMRVRVIA